MRIRPSPATRSLHRRRKLDVERLEAALTVAVTKHADVLLRAWAAEARIDDLVAARDAFRASSVLLAARVAALEAQVAALRGD